ncbi:heavy-metal-associated domain-containing protein [Asaia krungthepensis]|uniref:Cation/copper resistance transporter ATPase CopZ n=1 Tax=Asaia krungthepensis NRIC 0535 TaxID=1307925 RepID=A0ABQ0Q4Z8_9PROT|nr:heavy-metal-associated domain-containing protein [Asaia krungthepensis]GBQ91693.1 cation/copper resistance transporter ATPase CopZ [Asaia krungthepensis NRIC 0535]
MVNTMEFKVDGMSCSGCSSRLEKSLGEIPGLTAVTASHETGAVRVTTSDVALPRSAVETVIEETGFDVVRG